MKQLTMKQRTPRKAVMKVVAKLSLAVAGVLLLGGCAQHPVGPTPIVSSFSDVSTLAEGIAYARSLTAQTPDLAPKLVGLSGTLTELLPNANLAFDVDADLTQHLLSIKLDVLQNPADAVNQLPVLNQIANVMDGKKP